jgi:hypothetical protein
MKESELTIKPPGLRNSAHYRQRTMPGDGLLDVLASIQRANFTPKLGDDRDVVAIK